MSRTARAKVLTCLSLASIYGVTASAGAANADPAPGTPTQTTPTQTAPTPGTPLRVRAASPKGTAAGDARIRITFSAPLPASIPRTQLPVLKPRLAGHWSSNGNVLSFTPSSAYPAGTSVTVTVREALQAADGAHLRSPFMRTYTVGAYAPARLTQLLAQLGYLPLTLHPRRGQVVPRLGDRRAQMMAAFTPPRGRLRVNRGYPAALRALWSGNPDLVLSAAIKSFQSQHGMAMTGEVSAPLWQALLSAAAHGQRDPAGYTYALASEGHPETLTVWHNRRRVLQTLANTGAPGAATAPGTYPVYEKLQFQVMRGKNLDGSSYADPVYWVSYFNGGDAVHYFNRGSYGWPQSLGCVEIPWAQAKVAYGYLSYGSLVTVTP